jgi:cellulose biosynthesis protein BcsQ
MKRGRRPFWCGNNIPADPTLAENPAHGMDIFAYAADSAGAQVYRLLTMELLLKGFFQ